MKEKQNLQKAKQRRATRFLSYLSLGLVVAVWAGCKPEAKVAADTNPVGTYTLVSVDGNRVPCKVQHEGHPLMVKSGTFIINPDGTCSSKMDFSAPSGVDASRDVK